MRNTITTTVIAGGSIIIASAERIRRSRCRASAADVGPEEAVPGQRSRCRAKEVANKPGESRAFLRAEAKREPVARGELSLLG